MRVHQTEPLSWRLSVWIARYSTVLHPRLPRVLRIALRKVYGFDEWHTSVLAERAYARRLITYLNGADSAQRGSLVEIGCGLGDILRRAHYRQRLGLDREEAALRAARFLARLGRQRGIQFERFEFPQSRLSGVYDAIVMVNWIHKIERHVLKRELDEYFMRNLAPGGEIIVDTVADPSYQVNHTIDALVAGLACTVHRIGDFEHGRTLYAIRSEVSGRAPAAIHTV